MRAKGGIILALFISASPIALMGMGYLETQQRPDSGIYTGHDRCAKTQDSQGSAQEQSRCWVNFLRGLKAPLPFESAATESPLRH